MSAEMLIIFACWRDENNNFDGNIKAIDVHAFTAYVIIQIHIIAHASRMNNNNNNNTEKGIGKKWA